MNSVLDHNNLIRELLQQLGKISKREVAHAQRVAVYAVATGEHLGMSDAELQTLTHAALLHDIGKLNLGPEILNSKQPLGQSEVEQLQKHPALAQEVLAKIDWLEPSTPLIFSHHENWDGTGYPVGISGDNIPLGARLIRICESYDAMVSLDSYQSAMSPPNAVEILISGANSLFDPRALEAFLKIRPLIQPLEIDS